MNDETYMLAKAVVSATFSCLMNAYAVRDDEEAANKHFRHADKLEAKFISQHKQHPQAYIDRYEKQSRSEV